jgi:lipopolysaccharide assembly outer membrane protein LptD (OstA)
MRHFGLLLVVSLTLFGLAVLVEGQGSGISFGRTGSGTSFSGKADAVVQAGSVHTYRGNVTISFPTSSLVVQADEVAYDPDAKELVVRGTAHLKLDSK